MPPSQDPHAKAPAPQDLSVAPRLAQFTVHGPAHVARQESAQFTVHEPPDEHVTTESDFTLIVQRAELVHVAMHCSPHDRSQSSTDGAHRIVDERPASITQSAPFAQNTPESAPTIASHLSPFVQLTMQPSPHRNAQSSLDPMHRKVAWFPAVTLQSPKLVQVAPESEPSTRSHRSIELHVV